MPFVPTVLYPLTLSGLLQHILATQSGTSSTTLVICSSRDTFLGQLTHSLCLHENQIQRGSLQPLVTPSLHNLCTARHVKLAFCASVQALLAYLTAYSRSAAPAHTEEPSQKARLVLVNPLALHAPTPSFSAQGLARSFAAAVESALGANAILHVVECEGEGEGEEEGRQAEQEGEGQDSEMSNGDMEHEAEDDQQEKETKDPWDKELSILNVSARRFGSNSTERSWAGRTVTAKRVAARWFRFQKLDGQR